MQTGSMSAPAKVAAVVFVFALIAVALLIQHREAGFRHYYKHDFENARIVLTPKAKNGDPLAAYYLGRIYLLGQRTDKDLETARMWYLQSARKGIADGAVMYLYSNLSNDGNWPENCYSVVELLDVAARTKSITALLSLGKLYAKGVCGQTDLVKSAFYYTLAHNINKIYGAKSKSAVNLLSPSEKNRLEVLLNSPISPVLGHQFLDAFFSWNKAIHSPG